MSQVLETGSIAPSVAASLGLRRIECVRVFVGGGRPVAEVTGVARRYPRNLPISLASATRLADAGVPLEIVYRGEPSHQGVA
ncbi:MAG TPA: hypothetical protein VGM93_10845 [Acidimicrobiales bacterium]